MKYEVKEVVCDYGIYENDKLVLIVNDYYNAKLIVDILKIDTEKKRYQNPIQYR
ncbi:hypothetical protein [Romboutsia sp. 1001713B170131_170501_G6]|uniref:hypothetical protein n=1 Tax=Romboutsia sp. 1001713B170131_170501_G6 TaxID=2787108 RepID=UPI0018A9DB23|nr:hypothetical protein [Romboutsia sp. 1001713B170131_170501_G6]